MKFYIEIFSNSNAPRAPWLNKLRIEQGRQRGASRSLNLVIYELCRFIPAYKAGLSRHLPVKNGILSKETNLVVETGGSQQESRAD